MQSNTYFSETVRNRPPQSANNRNGGKPTKKLKRAIRNREKARAKGFENEKRFLEIASLLKAMWPQYIIGFEKATLKEDLFNGTDAWCKISLNGEDLRLPIQIKSSYEGKQSFLKLHPNSIYIVVVVHVHRSNRDIFRDFLFELNETLDVLKQ